MNFIARAVDRLAKPPSTNYPTGYFTHHPYQILPSGSTVLDLGAKGRKGGYWKGASRMRIISLDLVPTPGLTIAGDAHAIPLASESIDAVVCVSVLMYTANPQMVANEIWRVLKPSGFVFISAPFVFRTAPDGPDLFRFSVDGLATICRAFEPIQTGFNRGPASIMADLLPRFLALLLCCGSTRLWGVLVDVIQTLLFWIKYFDRWIAHYDAAKCIYSGSFFWGRKPPKPAKVSADDAEPLRETRS